MAIPLAAVLRTLFFVLGSVMVVTLIYTISIDGLPFRRELLTPWMAATLVDFYINVVPLAAWTSYKESNSISAIIWIILLVCFGRDGMQQKRQNSPVVVARIAFSILGCLMLGTLIYTIVTDRSPFRKDLLTPWMDATLVDFYINVVCISVWVAYKESSWISSFLWITFLICFGSVATCAYIFVQLLQLTSQDPLYLVLLNKDDRSENRYERT
ncbi:uncharacterized protein LOC110672172 isoform X3 [Hevea brasiliensis]|uniref:uncharacterized protein LOC110672172 isoform X3 n=1 Tax=Hevea brasiliensis TaxID=3981 RepID=UPI0025FCE43E|nr:uncharacterized protein LOC110672172 isoform X3 [Hevea brasiliensis]